MQSEGLSNKNGQFFQSDFADNVGGTNLSDSVFKIQDGQAAGGYNFDYTLTGGIRKRLGPSIINSVADSQLRSLGFGLYSTASGGVKNVIRAAGLNLQLFDTATPSFTTLSQDTAAATTAIFTSGSTQTVNFSQFNNGTSNLLWAVGGGLTLPMGVYSSSKFTQNGIAPATGAITATKSSASGVLQDLTYTLAGSAPVGATVTIFYVAGGTAGSEVVTVSGTSIKIAIQSGVSTATQIRTAYNLVVAATNLASVAVTGTGSNTQTTGSAAVGVAGAFASTGTYRYAVALRKASTQVLSNVALDVSVAVAATTDAITIDLSGLTSLDATLVDDIYIYRSALSGVSGFTTGDLIAQLANTQTLYVDVGSSIASAQNIARAGNVVLDNSALPANTYNVMALFKQRLIVANNSTLYLSDLNKSESWPLTNVIQVPSAGPITGLAVVSFTSPQAQSLQELLVIYKEREMWVINGDDYTSWALLFIDQVGCPEQSLIVTANGFLAWIDFRGIYLWDGTSKPIYCSRLLEPLFSKNGDLDKTKLGFGTGEFFRKENEVVWYLSHKIYGEQKFAIKMDLRLTLPMIEQNLTGRNIEAVLIQDVYAVPIYAAMSYIPLGGNEEMMVLGDTSGFCYFSANNHSDGGNDYSFTYLTKALCMGDPNTQKLFHKVIVWVSDLGDWNLELDYWSNYRTADPYKSVKSLPISTENSNAVGLWDLAFWDVAFWDSYSSNVVPLIFNLQPGLANSNQGTALQLQFKNSTKNQPITIHAFSVIWSPLGGVTA